MVWLIVAGAVLAAGPVPGVPTEAQGETAAALVEQAGAQARAGQGRQALELYERALSLQRAGGHRAGEAATLASMARTLDDLGEPRAALARHGEALALLRALGDRAGAAAVLANIGTIHADLGERHEAVARYGDALPALREAGDRAGEARVLNNMGRLESELGEKQKALELYAQALAVQRAIGDVSGQATTLNNMGRAHDALGEKRKALELFAEALPLRRAAGDRRGEATTLGSIGDVHASLGDHRRALELFGQALAVQRATGHRAGEATTLARLGRLHGDLGEKQEALELLGQALALQRAVGDRPGEARTLNDLGAIHDDLGEKQKALELYAAALPVLRAVGDRSGEARTLNNMGKVQANMGEHRRALELYAQALPLHRAVGNRAGEAVTLSNVATVQAGLGEYRQAIELYARALAIQRAIGARSGEATTLNNLGKAHAALGDLPRALAHYAQALPLLRAVGYRAGEARTLTNLGAALAPTAPARAVLHYKQSVNLYQSLRRDIRGLDRDTQATYARSIAESYRGLADLLAEQGRLGEAEQVLGLLKDQEYFEFVQRDAKAIEGAPVALRGGEEAASRRYDELAGTLTALGREFTDLQRLSARTPEQQARYERLDAELRSAGDRFTAFLAGLDQQLAPGERGRGSRLREDTGGVRDALEELRQVEPGVVAVFTVATERNLRTILVTPDVQRDYTPPAPLGAAALGKLVKDLREALRDPRQDPRPLAHRLYAALVAPMEQDLAGARATTILWFLDGPLRYVPVAALHDGTRWVAERYRSVVVSSADSAALLKAPRRHWDVLGLGVTRAHEGFSALPGVRSELAAIVRAEGAGAAGVLPGRSRLDEDFTERALTDAAGERRAVIHVASHFAFEPGDARRSFLLLGDGTHLTLERLRSANRVFRNVDLLALSACDTGVGGGEGSEVEGLARIAREQGAAAVLATLWPVSDASIPVLMRRFYELREREGLSKAEALRRAQLEMASGALQAAGAGAERGIRAAAPASGPVLPGWTHPYHWAPFVLLGNGR